MSLNYQCANFEVGSKNDLNVSVLSTTLSDVTLTFLQDISQNNLRIIQLITLSPWSFWFEWVGFLCLYFGLVALMSYLITYHRNNRVIVRYILPILMIFNLWIGNLNNCQGSRFFFGLLTFAGSMSIFAQLQEKDSLKMTWFICASSSMFFDVPRRVRLLQKHERRYPSLGGFSTGMLYAILIDICTYLIREYIPSTISTENQFLFVVLIGGIWVMFCMAFVYFLIEIVTHLLGYHLPPMMRHHMPLLSVSLAEFWSVRWNPLVGKDLQECFYKPLRQHAIHRGLCMLNTFIGSAILHAWPQYLSTMSLQDMSMMFLFFFGQGLAVVMERIFVLITHTSKERLIRSGGGMLTITTPVPSSTDLTTIATKKEAPKDTKELRIRQKKAESEAVQSHIKSTPGQLWMELAVMFLIVGTCYITFELKQWTVSNTSFMTTVFVGLCTMQWKLQEKVHQHTFAFFEGLAMLFGWWWTIIAIITMLPLFALPVLHVVSSCYELSFVAGPVIRLMSCFLSQLVVPVLLQQTAAV
jgi:hypothetical protein